MGKVLVIGQSPPPTHGQAIMIEKMLEGDYKGIQLIHLRMSFSSELGEVGKFNLRKIFRLIQLIASIIFYRFSHNVHILYYPPAGPNFIPVLRDIIVLILTRWLFRKTIFHFHASGLTTIFPKLPVFIRLLFKAAYYYPDVVIRTSKFTPEDGLGLRAKKEFIIPYGIEDERKKYPRLNYTETDPVQILFVGTLIESKGVHILLETTKDLVIRGLNIHVKFMGRFASDEYSRKVTEYINHQHLYNEVEILGELTGDNKWNVFAQADIFCFPTYYESEAFSVVLLEALSFGLPVIATNWRGIPSIVEDGVCGFLVPIEDTKATTEKLEFLINHPQVRFEMGVQSRRRYQQYFSIEKYHERLREVFEFSISCDN